MSLDAAARRGTSMPAATHAELVTLLTSHPDPADAATALLDAYPQLAIDLAIEYRAADNTRDGNASARPASDLARAGEIAARRRFGYRPQVRALSSWTIVHDPDA